MKAKGTLDGKRNMLSLLTETKALQICSSQKISLLQAFLLISSLQFMEPPVEQSALFPVDPWLLPQPHAQFAQLWGTKCFNVCQAFS